MPVFSQPDTVAYWHAYLDMLAWQRGSLDGSANAAFLRAASLGVTEQPAFDEVIRRCVDAGDHPRAAKLAHQLRNAYAHAGNGTPSRSGEFSRSYSAAPKWPEPDFDAIDCIVRIGFGLVDLAEASPVRWPDGEAQAKKSLTFFFLTTRQTISIRYFASVGANRVS